MEKLQGLSFKQLSFTKLWQSKSKEEKFECKEIIKNFFLKAGAIF